MCGDFYALVLLLVLSRSLVVSFGYFLVGPFKGACLVSAEPPQAQQGQVTGGACAGSFGRGPSSGLRSQVGIDNQANGTDLVLGGGVFRYLHIREW